MNIIDRLNWRYATKKFDPDKTLSDQKLTVLKEAFNLTATSYGLQSSKMIIIKDRELRRKLLPFSWNQQQIVEASHLLILCIYKAIGEKDVDRHFDNVKAIRNTPEEILGSYRQSMKEVLADKSDEELRVWASKQLYIALGNLLAVCAVEGIDACPIEGFEPEKVDAFLELEAKGLHSVLMLAVGYRCEDDMFKDMKKVRKPLDEVIIEWP